MTQILTYVEIDVPTFTTESPEATETFRFAMATDYLPQDIDAIPSIDKVSFTPARISLGEDLGQRASLKISFKDHLHIFAGEPYDQGTFWGKWRGRYGTALRGREVRLIRGEVGQSIEQMDTRYYIVDSVSGPTPNGSTYTIEAKDVLKLADDDRAQAPLLSNGSLAGSIDDTITSASLSPTGIGDLEYPASGWVCFGGKEVCSFTRSGDSLTITRAQFGTVAQEHSSGDRAQLVLRYTGDDVADIIEDLLVNYADVPAAYIPISDWQEETSNFLNVIYARTITEPTSVNELISQLIEQAALALWWDDRAQRVRLNVLREISTDQETFDESRILEGSLSVKEQPTKRLSRIWTFYGQRDPTDSGANEDNFRAALATVDLDKETEYGSAEIEKLEGQWIETEAAATRHNSIKLSRFKDPPRAFAFDLFRDQAISPAAGYELEWWLNQDEQGNRVAAKIQVTQVTIHPDRIHIEAEEMLASGVIVLVNVEFLLQTGSLLEWQVPDDWNDADNFVACIGGGGAGRRGGGLSGSKGGGGGAFSRSTNLALSSSPLPTIEYRVGIGGAVTSGSGGNGGDTWFDGTSLASCTVGAEGGDGGTGRTSGGQGGSAANGTGDLTTSGGTGGNGGPVDDNPTGSGGGGAAGGPHGDGGNGGTLGTNDRSGGGGGGADDGDNGGNAADGNSPPGDGGDNRFGFGGGDASTPAGREGGGGRGSERSDDASPGGNGEQIWTQTVAPIISAGPGGGGGGAADTSGSDGADGGLYGGGGGGTRAGSAGSGAQGIIVISWREAE